MGALLTTLSSSHFIVSIAHVIALQQLLLLSVQFFIQYQLHVYRLFLVKPPLVRLDIVSRDDVLG